MKKIGRNDPCPCGSGEKYKQCCMNREEALAARKSYETASIHKSIQTALEHHQAGRLPEAEAIYQQVLKIAPSNPDALHLLGLIAHQVGENKIAAELIDKAIHVRPAAPMYNNLGLVLQAQGQLDVATAHYRKALSLNPDYAEAHYNLGNLLQAQGRLDDAIASYRKALAINPDYAEAYNNLGNAFHAQRNFDAAIENYCKALRRKPDYAEAHNNLGTAFKNQGRLDMAVESYRQALRFKSDYAEAHSNLGAALQEQGNLSEAVNCLLSAISVDPGYAEAHYNLGNLLQAQGRLDDAIVSYRKALAINPGYAEAYHNLGNAFQIQGKPDSAIEGYRKVLQLKPDDAEALNNLGSALKDKGKLDEAIASYRKALSIKPSHAAAHSNLLFALNFHPDLGQEEIYRASQEYEAQIGAPLRSSWPAHRNDKTPTRRLRIGYVSPDFRRHAVAHFAEPILANHDKSQVEIFCYADIIREDEYTARFRQFADHWHSIVGLNDDAVAKMIRDHQIDILVDLAGHTANNRLPVFARKPAPLQITYLGYPGTSGLSAMDYRLTDRYADPEGIADAYYSERLLRLSNSLCCYRPEAIMPETSPLPALERGYLTFGSFNNFNKVDLPTLVLWAALLRALPNARLMMLTVPEGEARQRLVDSFAEQGITAQRLEFHGKLSAAEFYRKFLEVDLTLDTVNVSGGTTTCESLWMGVPVIALAREHFITRVSYSFLSTAGLADFATFSPEDYIHLAVHLSDNLPLLAEIRAGLRAHVAASPLIDEVGFTRNLEDIYREIWGRWCTAT